MDFWPHDKRKSSKAKSNVLGLAFGHVFKTLQNESPQSEKIQRCVQLPVGEFPRFDGSQVCKDYGVLLNRTALSFRPVAHWLPVNKPAGTGGPRRSDCHSALMEPAPKNEQINSRSPDVNVSPSTMNIPFPDRPSKACGANGPTIFSGC